MKELIFYYDVICPYAYLASRLVEDVAKRTGTLLKWRPVLLGGIYNATKAPNESAGSIKAGMCDAKRLILGQDLARLYGRNKIPCSPFGRVPDISTLYAMRLIASTPSESDDLRASLTHDLFNMVWVEKEDAGDIQKLQVVADKFGMNIDVEQVVKAEGNTTKQILISNTEEAVQRGAFGVPSFWVNDKLFFGADRLHFVEQELSGVRVEPPRLQPRPKASVRAMKLTIYHDFTSPWSFLGFKQIQDLVQSVAPVKVEVEWIPILLGALFNAIGTPQIPLMHAGENKRSYSRKDFSDWCNYLNIRFQFPSHFPFNVVLPARVSIAQPDMKILRAVYDTAWLQDRDIGDKEVMQNILQENGYDADDVMERAVSPEVKLKLRENTQRAVDTGLCGVPSYQVNDGMVIWGQDRLNIVADLLCGYPDKMILDGEMSKL